MTSRLDTNMGQKGGILVYILIAIFLTGMLIASMTQGARKSASSEQLNEMMMYLQTDIQTIQSNITECVVSYQNNNFCPPSSSGGCTNQYSTQDSGNPNVPFPVYTTNPSTGGTAGIALASILCPRAPTAVQTIFNTNIIQSLRLLQDTTNYTVTYFTTSADGVYFRITRAFADPLWTEAIASNRLPSKYGSCTTVVETSNPDPTGFNCSNGCLYYFILRLHGGSSVFPACS